MGKLNNAVLYLSGSMEADPQLGVGWRREFINLLKEKNLNIITIDPTNKPKSINNVNAEEEATYVNKLRNEEKWEELTKYVKKFTRADLRFCDLSDALILYVDTSIFMCGSIHEAVLCQIQKKPRFAIVKGGLKAMPSWLFGIFDYRCVFDSVEKCVEHLAGINAGTIKMDDKWVLIREHLTHYSDSSLGV